MTIREGGGKAYGYLFEDNVRYKGLNNKLYADIVEIDLVTKFSKIYMLDNQKKVKVELKQNGSN